VDLRVSRTQWSEAAIQLRPCGQSTWTWISVAVYKLRGVLRWPLFPGHSSPCSHQLHAVGLQPLWVPPSWRSRLAAVCSRLIRKEFSDSCCVNNDLSAPSPLAPLCDTGWTAHPQTFCKIHLPVGGREGDGKRRRRKGTFSHLVEAPYFPSTFASSSSVFLHPCYPRCPWVVHHRLLKGALWPGLGTASFL
jgi:hypothetical protein